MSQFKSRSKGVNMFKNWDSRFLVMGNARDDEIELTIEKILSE